jgi:hypothetical protein
LAYSRRNPWLTSSAILAAICQIAGDNTACVAT